MQVLVVIDLNHTPHVFFLDKIDNLATISHDFQGLTCHDYLHVLKNLPVLEASHDPRENLIKVFVHGRVLVAKLFGLIKKRLAE